MIINSFNHFICICVSSIFVVSSSKSVYVPHALAFKRSYATKVVSHTFLTFLDTSLIPTWPLSACTSNNTLCASGLKLTVLTGCMWSVWAQRSHTHCWVFALLPYFWSSQLSGLEAVLTVALFLFQPGHLCNSETLFPQISSPFLLTYASFMFLAVS